MFTLKDLNEGQMEIATDILEKVESIMKRTPEDLEDRIFSIQGFAGSGKTVLTSVLLGELKDRFNPRIMVTTPTHKALAVLNEMASQHNIESRTIHSYLQCKVKEDYTSGKHILEQAPNFNPEPLDILVVDEASMVSDTLFELIQECMMRGLIKVLIQVGDASQLIPIEGNWNPVYDGLIFAQEYKLNQIVRQAEGNPIIQLASTIRECIDKQEFKPISYITDAIKAMNHEDIEIYSRLDKWMGRYEQGEFDKNLIVCHQNKTVDMYNKKARELDKGKKIPYIIEGEKLVFLEAHFEGRGDDAEMIHANNEIITVKECKMLEDDNNELEYWKVYDTDGLSFITLDKNSKVDFQYELGEIAKEAKRASGSARSALWKQFFDMKAQFQNVAYTYASTITKAQGSSCDEVYVDWNELVSASRFLELEAIYRLAYVAITRARNKAIFFIK